MHGDAAFADAFAAAWTHTPSTVEVVFCPPLAYLPRLAAALAGRGVGFGAQNTAIAAAGAYTGEHSAQMARDLGARYALVGHSERRRLFAETDAVVAQKFAAAQNAGLTPILCIGETRSERDAGAAESAVAAQIDAVCKHAGADALRTAVFAYEPVWAIGTGRTATPGEAQSMHGRIRARLQALAGSDAVPRLLYGGSLNAGNAASLFAERDIDGGLVGGASLDAEAFAAICTAAARRSGRANDMTATETARERETEEH